MKVSPIKLVKSLINANVKPSVNPAKWDKYVKLDQELDSDTFNYIYNLRSTIGNYAKKEGLQVNISKAENDVKVQVQSTILGAAQSQKIKPNMNNKEQPAFARQIYSAIEDMKNGLVKDFIKRI